MRQVTREAGVDDGGGDGPPVQLLRIIELSARVKALLRRTQHPPSLRQCWKLGEVEIDFARQQATRRGRPIRLSFREFELLRCLATRRGEVVTRDELLEQALGYSPSVSSRAVDNLIVHLRKKIEADPHDPRHILTAYGIGYKLVE